MFYLKVLSAICWTFTNIHVYVNMSDTETFFVCVSVYSMCVCMKEVR